jgi:CubicO group peptidase (beta-lactamase class C family)
MNAIDRRSFLQRMSAAYLLQPSWKSKAPAAYLGEISTLMRAAPAPGAVIGAVDNHKVSWIAPLGVRTAGSSEPVTGSTLFQAASLTKQVTTHAAFALHSQGKLEFDKCLVDYVDDLANPVARTVTLRHVLSHSSGFPNWRFAASSTPLPDLAPAFTPGSRFQYSAKVSFTSSEFSKGSAACRLDSLSKSWSSRRSG